MDASAVDAQKIREVEFRERMRGYHQEDVDEFLEQVAKGVEVLEGQLSQAREELARLKANPPVVTSGAPAAGEFGDDVIQRTLIVAQKAADQLRSDAENEAREIRAEAQRQAERILGEARTTSRLIEEERRKNLLEELTQLEGEFARRQEQLANIVSRDRAVRQRITDEIGGLLSLVRAAEVPTGESLATTPALGGVPPREFNDAEVGEPVTVAEVRNVADVQNSADDTRHQLADVVPSQPEEQRPVQEFVFGHDLSGDAGDEEPFMLWRQDD
ncbi:DivIVA domain-containing protein [Ferrimicrobium sp.]|uniref:DivIVA domain-containing protein n=1 Tax=Ferrimicrobium sp. TaxID=2926050 RepID=UPI00261F01AE|nr:DivIVA domain-containing protein [Ferrimicrobium sp.]